MPKNIHVIDINYHEIGMTYPKRAKGLVRHGRAVWLDAQTIRMSHRKGVETMSTKEALLAIINEMSEPQIYGLLTFLNTFSKNPPEAVLPETAPGAEADTVRTEMIKTLQSQIATLAKDNYASPNAVDVLKELKDMLNMILRV